MHIIGIALIKWSFLHVKNGAASRWNAMCPLALRTAVRRPSKGCSWTAVGRWPGTLSPRCQEHVLSALLHVLHTAWQMFLKHTALAMAQTFPARQTQTTAFIRAFRNHGRNRLTKRSLFTYSCAVPSELQTLVPHLVLQFVLKFETS